MEGTPAQGMEQRGKIMHDWKWDLECWGGVGGSPGHKYWALPPWASMENWRVA